MHIVQNKSAGTQKKKISISKKVVFFSFCSEYPSLSINLLSDNAMEYMKAVQTSICEECIRRET